MNSLKNSFLLSKSLTLEILSVNSHYDHKRGINISRVGDKYIPTASVESNLSTQSKTLSAPGDDDPDVEAEHCY